MWYSNSTLRLHLHILGITVGFGGFSFQKAYLIKPHFYTDDVIQHKNGLAIFIDI